MLGCATYTKCLGGRSRNTIWLQGLWCPDRMYRIMHLFVFGTAVDCQASHNGHCKQWSSTCINSNAHIWYLFHFLGSNFLGHAKTTFIKCQLIMPLESFGELTRWYNQIANLPIAFLLERSLRKHMVRCIFTGLGGNMPNKWPVMTNLFVCQEKTPTQRHMQSLGTRLASPEAECSDAGRTWQVWSRALKANEISEASEVWLKLSNHADRTI